MLINNLAYFRMLEKLYSLCVSEESNYMFSGSPCQLSRKSWTVCCKERWFVRLCAISHWWELCPFTCSVLDAPWRKPIQYYVALKTFFQGLSLYFWEQLAGNFPVELFLIQSYFWLIFFSWKCLLFVENSGDYSKVSAEICVNQVQFCKPKLENLCEEALKPAVVVSTGENSIFFMRWDASLKGNISLRY